MIPRFVFLPIQLLAIAAVSINHSACAQEPEPARNRAEQEMVREVASLLDRACDQDTFSGTVLVAKGEEVLFTHACGEASKRFHVPNNIDTKFNLGSMNKMFTSTAVMQLVDRGVLSLSDTLSKFIDESWLPRSVSDQITIHHLLTHTSGLGSYFNQTYWESSRELFRDLGDYKPLIRDERPAFEPGTDYQYSNTGMFLLGVVIESATGTDYFDQIREGTEIEVQPPCAYTWVKRWQRGASRLRFGVQFSPARPEYCSAS